MKMNKKEDHLQNTKDLINEEVDLKNEFYVKRYSQNQQAICLDM